MRHREEANRDRLAWLMVICHLLLQLVANVFMAVWAFEGTSVSDLQQTQCSVVVK